MRVILIAAGRGRRLMPTTADAPKCYAEVAGRRLLDWALAAFDANGLGDVCFIGGYQIEVRVVPLLTSLTNVINSTLAVIGEVADDLHTDDTMLTASLLPLRLGQTDARYDFAYNGTIRDSWDVDFYRLQAPTAPDGKANVMWSPYTPAFNLTRHPAASVPCGLSRQGLPIGLQVIGKPFDESTLLSVAHRYEQQCEWWTRHPDF